MLQRILDEYFADTGAMHHHCLLNGMESSLIIANCEILQKQWAKENSVKYSEANWQKEIALEQIKKFKPDFFYIESIFDYYGDFLKRAKSYCDKVIAWISTPFADDLNLSSIDLILSSTPVFVEKFNSMGIKSFYQLPAFDERVLTKIKSVKKDIPFSFVGGWSWVHINRKVAIEKLVENTPIELWGYGYLSRKTFSKRTLKYYTNLLFPSKDEVLERYNGEVWGIEMYEVLSRSLVTFNIHEALLNGRVGNMRMFEASGVGTMLLNDEGENLSSIFVPGREIETYTSIEDAAEKAKYYMNNPQKAIEIGKNAQQRTLRDYNYNNFVLNLKDYLKSL